MPDEAGEGAARLLPQLRIDELIDELQARLSSVRSSRDRVRQLLEAVVAIGSGLDLESALTRIVQAAVTLVDAQYGALGVLGPGETLSRFITVGIDEQQVRAIGPFPTGKGVLGELIHHPEPLRIEDLTTHPHSYGFPANHPPMRTFLGVPIRVREEVFGNLYMTEKQGGAPFDADDEAVLTALAAAAGVAIDNARLYDEARRRQRWLEATNELTRGLLSGQDTDDVLTELTQRLVAFTAADVVFVALSDQGEDGLLVVAADGSAAELLRGRSLPLDGTVIGEVYRSAGPVVISDMRADERFADDPMARQGAAGPALLVPIGTQGSVHGVLGMTRRAGVAGFDEVAAGLARDLGVQASVALELAERRREGELLSLYADRDRIGRDLHDLAIQRLFATSMSLQGAYKITQKPAVAKRIAQAVTDLDDTIKVIRSTIFALQAHEDSEADVPSVRAQVIALCERAAEQLGFAPAVRFTGPVDTLVTGPAAEHVTAVLAEALSNAARHAKASRVEVALEVDGRVLTLTVADDGVGIPQSGRRSGLANLAERAAELGGSFQVGAGSAGGTILTWSVPSRTGEEDGATH